jgi:hypothetical protein
MGYYTYHILTVLDKDGKEVSDDQLLIHQKAIAELSGYNEYMFEDSIKWYNIDDDMIEYSKRHPELLFLIERDGEETEDYSKEHYKNGKSLSCQGIMSIVYEEFDESKMK